MLLSVTNLLLLLTAMIWGFAFVAQRMGMDYVGPFTFNAARFALGGLSLVPVIYFLARRKPPTAPTLAAPVPQVKWGGLLLGAVLFTAASLQQVGLVYTPAGKAGFITGLYVVMVPVIGIFARQKVTFLLWLGVLLAVVGMYLLSITEGFYIAFGDAILVLGALFWAVHVQLTGYLSPRTDPIRLARCQFLVCALCSFVTALIFEKISLQGLINGINPLLYGGLLSVGVAYTLQVVVQKTADPTYAAVILSLEAVFAVVGGWLVLGETLTVRALVGCVLMLVGMLAAQFDGFRAAKSRRQNA